MFSLRMESARAASLSLIVLSAPNFCGFAAFGQVKQDALPAPNAQAISSAAIASSPSAAENWKAANGVVLSPTVARYFDPLQGVSSNDLIRRALATNGELLAARLDIERARARLRQAGLRPNPTIDFEQTTGRLTGSAGERETTIGLAVPLELGGKRQRRIELAQAELQSCRS